MAIDWTLLAQRTRAYEALQAVPDRDGRIDELVFCGLRAGLADLQRHFPAGGGRVLTLCVDTLVVDAPAFDAAGVVVVARRLELQPPAGAVLPVRRPGAGGGAAVELLVGDCAGGPLRLADDGGAPLDVPVGTAPLQAGLFTLAPAGALQRELLATPAELGDLLHTTWALNALKASLAAATWLADEPTVEARETARAMLRWVLACVGAVAQAAGALSGEQAELQGQAAALLVTLDIGSAACHVPALAPQAYGAQARVLVDVLGRHEAQLLALDGSAELQRTIAEVSATLDGVARDQSQPLREQLARTEQALIGLRRDAIALATEADARRIAAEADLAVLKAKISASRTFQMVEAVFTLLGNVVKAACAMTGEDKEPGDAAGALLDGIKNVMTLVDLGTRDDPDHALLDRALHLARAQARLTAAFLAGTSPDAAPAAPTETPLSEAADLADPAAAWDGFLAEAEAAMTTVKEDIGTGLGAGEAQAAANRSLATLKLLAQYAKALNATLGVAAGQGAQAIGLRAQIAAAESAGRRWLALQGQARSSQEQRAALKGLLQMRCDGLRRALFASWLNYRDAYHFLLLEEPPRPLRPDMGAAEFGAAFAALEDWLGRRLGDAAALPQVRLPDEDVTVAYRFRIVRAGEPFAPDEDVAVLTPRSATAPATLAWSIPIGGRQLAGVLPDGGGVALWIRQAAFFVEGAVPNAKGNVIVEVSTSGTYENGFGTAAASRFVGKAMVGNFAYRAADERVYNPWNVERERYTTPTPFTQWRLAFDPDGGDAGAARWLRVELRVAYRRAERAPAGAAA